MRPNESAALMGSSPLARGTLLLLCLCSLCGGLIPARAGNTHSGCKSSNNSWAHPRSRGEHPPETEAPDLTKGSSPLARGTPHQALAGLPALGLIPARAGNTHPRRGRCRPSRAHPRSRGEHRPCQRHQRPQQGSSPLARGTPSVSGVGRDFLGLIPARAGNTRGCELAEAARWVGGSSPLARGTQRRRSSKWKHGGLIPARAGNTQRSCFIKNAFRAHPRSRGEHGNTNSDK